MIAGAVDLKFLARKAFYPSGRNPKTCAKRSA
jgi:hypothetical protein